MQSARRTQTRVREGVILSQIAMTLILAGFLIAVFALAFMVGYQILYANVIFPGVSVGGVDLSSLTIDDARALILNRVTYPQDGRVVFLYGDRQWAASPAELGLLLDFNATAQLAYNVGRSGGLGQRLLAQSSARGGGIDIQPVFILDQDKAYQLLNSIADEIYLPVREPAIHIDGTEVLVNQGQNGRQMDVAGALNLTTLQVHTLRDGVIPLTVDEQAPLITDPEKTG